jgi:hypothetical protein
MPKGCNIIRIKSRSAHATRAVIRNFEALDRAWRRHDAELARCGIASLEPTAKALARLRKSVSLARAA